MENLTFEEIEQELEKLYEILDEKFHNSSLPWEDYVKFIEPENKRVAELSRMKRMIMPYTLDEVPDFADVMPLSDFIRCVNDGGFIDYDGFGRYVKDGKETNIEIYPSDVKHNAIRKEFDSVAWYNR